MAGRNKTKAEPRKPPRYPGVTANDVVEQEQRKGRIKFTPELGERICQLIACRVSVVRICEMEGMPAVSTLYAWLEADSAFGEAYARARAFRAQARADRIDELHDQVARGELDPTTARVLFDMERWQAGKERPSTYGDHVKTEITGVNGGPRQVEHQLDDFELARRLLVIAPELFDTVKALKDNTVNGVVIENGYTRLLSNN